MSGESLLPGSQTELFSLCPPTAAGARKLSGFYFTNPTEEGLASCPHHSPKAPLLKTITLGIRLQHRNMGGGGDTNTQFIAEVIIFKVVLIQFIFTGNLKFEDLGGAINNQEEFNPFLL